MELVGSAEVAHYEVELVESTECLGGGETREGRGDGETREGRGDGGGARRNMKREFNPHFW